MFDLNTLAVKDSFTLHLKHPVSEELLYADEAKTQPVQIILYSTSSKAWREALNASQNRSLKRGKKQLTAEDQRSEGVELLTACSQKAINLQVDGEVLDNSAAFRKLYADDRFSWLKSQVDEALGDVSNFIQA